MKRFLKRCSGQIAPEALAIALAVALAVFAAETIKSGLHKVGCKLHIAKNCAVKK